MKFVLSGAIFLFSVIAASMSAFAADEPAFDQVTKTQTIRCGYFSYPPYIAKDPNSGKLSGINYDIFEAMGKNLGLKIEWVSEIGIGEVVAALGAHKFDVMCASLWPDPARNRLLTFTDPTFFSVVHAFVRADDHRFDGHLDQANRSDIKISVIEGDVGTYLATEKLPLAQQASLPQTASGAEILMQVINHKADIALVDRALVADFSSQNPGKIREVSGIPPIRVFGEHLMIAKGEYGLRDMLNVSLHQLINDGTVHQITSKYAQKYKSEFLAPQPSVLFDPTH